jgi:hypothetical protein
VATHSLKRGTIWQNDFKKMGDFNQKFLAVLPFLANFRQKQKGCSKQTGSFPSAGKPLVDASHTSPTSSICIVHN